MLQNITPDILYKKIVATLRYFFQNNGADKAVLGLSGGIDSAVAAVLAVEAIGSQNVCGILMPSPYSTMHSLTDAVELGNNLGIKYKILPIDHIFNRFVKESETLFESETKKITEENIQARLRGLILMTYSNQTGSLVLNTTNKSELAVGYGTLYGDLSGAIMVLADVYKLNIYALANYINREKTIIPTSSIVKSPSAELSIDQKDSDTLPEYTVLDPILHDMIESGKSIEQLIASGVDPSILEKIKMMISRSKFKLLQIPPMIQIGDHPLLPPYKCIKI